MKLTFGILLTVVAVTLGQNEPHVTEGLLSAQGDLSLGHQFFETALMVNRDEVSTYMSRIGHEIVTSHTDAYGTIKLRALDTVAEIDAIEVNDRNDQCLQGVRDRFELQTRRFGHRLSDCITTPYNMLSAWNVFLNNIHSDSQETSNQVQNLGNKVLSEADSFDGRETFPALINREFRDLFTNTRQYTDRYDIFLGNIQREIENVIQILSNCDRAVEVDFEVEIANELRRLQICANL